MTRKNSIKTQKTNEVRTLGMAGNILIIASLIGFIFTFGQAFLNESEYRIKKTLKITNYVKDSPDNPDEKNKGLLNRELTPPNLDFSIIIPKIGAVAPVISNVDPFEEKDFLQALRRGVAHAKSTSYPGTEGNIYIFAHSTDAFYNVGRYNAVFYLIGKLEAGDEIYLYYKGTKYTYIVFDKMVVDPSALEYLEPIEPGLSTLTLQTCYPPGTTLKRLIVLSRETK